MFRSALVKASRATLSAGKCLRTVTNQRQDPSCPADAEPKQAAPGETRFGDYTRAFAGKTSFRKANPEQHDLRYSPEEADRPRFRSRTGRRNTQYWYLLQCKQLIKRNMLAEALSLFENDMLEGEKLQPEEYNYTVLIGGCGRAGYIKKAFKLYNDMKKRSLEPSAATYTALFNACAESPWKPSGLEQALKLWQELRQNGVPLNGATHHALLKAVARSGDLRTCFEVLRKMLQSGQAITQETFQYLIMCCVEDKHQGFRVALQVWHQMLRAGIKPDGQNYAILLRAARDCGIGDLDSASVLLLRGRDDPAPNHMLDLDAFERRLLADSLPVSDSALTPTSHQPRLPNLLDPNSCHSDVVALAPVPTASDRLALIGGLDGFLGKMAGDGLKPGIKMLTLLADVAEPSGRTVQILVGAAQDAGVTPDVPFFNALIKRAARAGDLEGAKAVKSLMLDSKLRANTQTFCCLALACSKFEDGLQLLLDMETCGVAPNCHVFSALISQATRRLDYAYLRELLHQMHRLQVPPNEVIIKQLEFAAQYPLNYDQSKNTYLGKIDGFRGFYKQWLEFMPAQPTPHPWEKYRLRKAEDESQETDKSNDE